VTARAVTLEVEVKAAATTGAAIGRAGRGRAPEITSREVEEIEGPGGFRQGGYLSCDAPNR
jgi:hypothetical protein